MKSIRAKEILAHKFKSGIKLPDDEMLSELFLEAMLFIASKCVPNELIRKGIVDSDKVFRNIADGFFVCVPDKPNFSDANEHIMLDESLTYALINEVAFLINREPFYRQMTMDLIAQFNASDGKEIL